MEDMERFAQVILLIVIIFGGLLANLIKKLNDFINRKRMEIQPRSLSEYAERERQREAARRERWDVEDDEEAERQDDFAQDGGEPPPSASTRPADVAETIMRQLEAMLPPEIQEQRRLAREAARQAKLQELQRSEEKMRLERERQAALLAAQQAEPAPGPARPGLVQERLKLLKSQKAQTSLHKLSSSLGGKPVRHASVKRIPAGFGARRVKLDSKNALRQAVLMQEILGPPAADRKERAV
ncbi:MAG: hypothetical protein BWZ10_01289 [candidate division BRC1 bacterium ADurb.BinA364]|nr:MAG: hypothetical protein BWZ10_01289 [candidate division BRC1 bacterium ADurb.BinA364]